jgi:hypothetical protein
VRFPSDSDECWQRVFKFHILFEVHGQIFVEVETLTSF